MGPIDREDEPQNLSREPLDEEVLRNAEWPVVVRDPGPIQIPGRDIAPGGWGGIFISYRRQETSDFAGRLYDRLADRFGKAKVFMDVDTIELGLDFAEAITEKVDKCKVLLAVIGPSWLTTTGKNGRRRLDDPDDIVRLEIQAALERDVRVIPILVRGAVMLQRQELPESLGELARRNGLAVRHESFPSDVAQLIAAIERVVAAGTGGDESVG